MQPETEAPKTLAEAKGYVGAKLHKLFISEDSTEERWYEGHVVRVWRDGTEIAYRVK